MPGTFFQAEPVKYQPPHYLSDYRKFAAGLPLMAATVPVILAGLVSAGVSIPLVLPPFFLVGLIGARWANNKVLDDSDQGVIIENLEKFLQLTTKPSHELLTAIRRGLCRGLSITNGVMRVIGKREWWQNALVEFANWDGHPKSLEETIIIPGLQSKTPINKKQLFNIIFHFVLQAQITHYDGLDYGFDIERWLDNTTPNTSFLGLIDQNNQPKPIMDRAISPMLDTSDLNFLLTTNLLGNINNTIYLNSLDHTIEVSFDPKTHNWHIYNPNFPHESIQTMNFTTNSKEKFIDKIQSSLNEKISVEICNFESKDALNESRQIINNIIQTKKLNLIKNGGLTKILTEIPERLPDILAAISNEKDANNILLQCLNDKSKEISNWFILFNFAAEQVPEVLKFLSNSPTAVDTVLRNISTCDIFKENCWHAIVCKPAIIQSVLDYIATAPDAEVRVAKGLCQPDIDGMTPLSMLCGSFPQFLPLIFGFISKSPEASQILAAGLNAPDKSSKTPLDFMAGAPNEIYQPVEEFLQNSFVLKPKRSP